MKRLVSVWMSRIGMVALMLDAALWVGRVAPCAPFARTTGFGSREMTRLTGEAAAVLSSRVKRSKVSTYTVKVVPLLMRVGLRDVDFIYSIERQRFSELARSLQFVESEIRWSFTSNHIHNFIEIKFSPTRIHPSLCAHLS